MMVVSDPVAGKVLGTPAIDGSDGVAFDDGLLSARMAARQHHHVGERRLEMEPAGRS